MYLTSATAPPMHPILGMVNLGQAGSVLRDMGPIGPSEGFGSVEEAVQGLADATRGADDTAGIFQRGGRFHGRRLGMTDVTQLAFGGLDRPAVPLGLRGLLHHGHATTIDLVEPSFVGIVDGGFNELSPRNSGVVLLERSLRLGVADVEPLTPRHAAENAGRLIDLATL